MRFIFYLIFLIFFSCSSKDNNVLVYNSGEAQGSYYHIKYMSDNGLDYHSDIDSIFMKVDSSLSIYKKYSLISRLNSGEIFKTDSLFNIVFNAAKRVYIETEGNFDCSVTPLINAWGFYKEILGDSIVVDSTKFRSILNYVGFDKIQLIRDSLLLPEKMSLDFNSIAQGFTVNLIASHLEDRDVRNYLIEVGGEILAKGKNDDGEIWKIGVDKPNEFIDSGNRFQFILNLEDKALATSGNYRKFYEINGVKYSHMINPFTGFPTRNNLLSVTVIHDDCMLADAYATSFMVMGVKQTKRYVGKNPEIEIYLIYTGEDGNWRTYISPNMKKRIVN